MLNRVTVTEWVRVNRLTVLQTCEGEDGQSDCEDGPLSNLLHWLATPPMCTTLRVNTMKSSVQAAKELVEKELQQVVCVCVCKYGHTCIYVECMCVHVCVWVCVCVCVCVCVRMCVCVCMYMCDACIHICIYMCVCVQCVYSQSFSQPSTVCRRYITSKISSTKWHAKP